MASAALIDVHDLELQIADNTQWSVFFLRLAESPMGEDEGRWVRDKLLVRDVIMEQLASDLFWSDRNPHEVLEVGVLQGDILNRDKLMYGDQPDIKDPVWQAKLAEYNRQLAADPSLGQPFTVLAAWMTEAAGFKRYLVWHTAIDALHAELLARDETQAGTFLVSTVVTGHMGVRDSAELDVYCTPDGRPLSEHPDRPGLGSNQGHRLHGLFHHDH